VSRIIAGKLRLELRITDLSAIVRDALEVVRPSAEAKEITLHVDRCDEPMVLVGDATRLQQVIWNLLSNAVKFSDRGGSVRVQLEQGGASISLAVRDTGRGIEPDFLPHIFERFSQADSSVTRRAGGLGLGLSIVRHIVELHGGTAEASSAGKDKGSTFTITLPVRAIAPAEAPSAEPVKLSPESVRLEGISVLVVDDEADARELLVAMLESRGARVTSVESASEARAKLGAGWPEVIVSDIGMQGEDGYAFARTVRALPRGDEVCMVALTAYASAHDRRRAFDAGFNNHIPKPVDPEELASVVRSLINFARR
jgi:CheY-like chemotaxis protein/two-component sensor histidine kinase